MIYAIAIDDEPEAIDILSFHAAKVPFLEMKATFRSARKAYDYLKEHEIDLIFLDINMPDITGLDFAKMLGKGPSIIFTTAYSEFAVESYEVEATDYLLKPIGFDRFLKAVQRIEEKMSTPPTVISTETTVENAPSFLLIKSGTQLVKVALEEILYIESDGNYLTYFTAEKRIISRINMTNALAELPQNAFFRVHKSFIIHFKHIESIDSYQVKVKGKQIPIGSSYRSAFQDWIQRQ